MHTLGSPTWLENERLVEQMIEREEMDNLFLKKNIKFFSRLFRFLYNYQLMKGGSASAIYTDEIANGCYSERTITMKMLELLKRARFIEYTFTKDIYKIRLINMHVWKNVDMREESMQREQLIYYYVSW